MESAADWHKRYTTQARWTEQVRRYLYQAGGLFSARRVLEVGCGTGVITSDLRQNGGDEASIYGLDLRFDPLRYARALSQGEFYLNGNGLNLPFEKGTFDLTVCHFLLLWLKEDAQAALAEMVRVTRRGGFVLALAEPDYGGRIDYPDALEEAGRLQTEGMRSQGADPSTGRKLGGMFHKAGLAGVQTGLLGGQWGKPLSAWEWESEWAVMEHDLAGKMGEERFNELVRLDFEAWQRGERVLFVPTFYAAGQAKS